MTKEEVLSKVRKLFELSNSPNENEAALAASKARELLARYNLSIAELPPDDMNSALKPTEASVRVGKAVRNWVKGLLIHVAEGFDCEHIIRRRHGSDPILSFIGTPADAAVAVSTFQFLYRQLHRLLERALPRLKGDNRNWSTAALKSAYLDGAVKRIGERFREQTQAIRAVERDGCKALVLVKEQMINNYMAAAFPNIRLEYGRRRVVSAAAFEKGYCDAGTIHLRPGTANEGSERLAVTT
ncbi:MAG: DUF2786 domain-containing protein [Desulfomonile tiedjei]|nr:DUF2786 domain-containing protein [Desulfomonile tiedjei]